jgi:cytosine/adenosine deaminase-related metal-dependent hydrolase
MDPGIGMNALDLHGATVVTSAGAARAPLSIRGRRIGAGGRAGSHAPQLRLDDHLVFPGLVNAHDHLHVNAVPPLARGRPFGNSYEWIEAFKAHFDDPGVRAALALPLPLRLRHGGLKNLLAGTTCVAHHDPWHAACASPGFPVEVLRDYGWSYAPGWPGYGPDLRGSFARTPEGHPWIVHLAEGTDAIAQAELATLDAAGCLAPNSVLVHGVGLRDSDVERVIGRGAAVVWCPGSNHFLLGRTLYPHRLHDAGRLALGTDSRLTGARDLLEEMRGVLERGELGAAALLELATRASARILRMPGRGALSPGDCADLVVVADAGKDPALALPGLRRSQLRAVVRNGKPCIADRDLGEWFALAGVDTVPVLLDGVPKLLARALADPALVALEPGLELVETRSGRQHAAVRVAEPC